MTESLTTTEELLRISTLLKTQDNRITSHPMYCVQSLLKISGMDTDYAKDIVWLDTEESSEVDPTQSRVLEDEYQDTGDVPEGYIRTGYVEIWEDVTYFFTNEAAEQYILDHAYDLNKPMVYVKSGYRNSEFQLIRRYLMSLTDDPAQCEVSSATKQESTNGHG